jgi:hypothetical protein
VVGVHEMCRVGSTCSLRWWETEIERTSGWWACCPKTRILSIHAQYPSGGRDDHSEGGMDVWGGTYTAIRVVRGLV